MPMLTFPRGLILMSNIYLVGIRLMMIIRTSLTEIINKICRATNKHFKGPRQSGVASSNGLMISSMRMTFMQSQLL